jgi:hypothetical protein
MSILDAGYCMHRLGFVAGFMLMTVPVGAPPVERGRWPRTRRAGCSRGPCGRLLLYQSIHSVMAYSATGGSCAIERRGKIIRIVGERRAWQDESSQRTEERGPSSRGYSTGLMESRYAPRRSVRQSARACF